MNEIVYPYTQEIDGYTVEFLDPKILVFKNAVKNGKELIEFYERTAEWGGWYGFGTQIADSGPGIGLTDEFPSREDWDRIMLVGEQSEEGQLRSPINVAFYEASKIYMDAAKLDMPSYAFSNWGLAKYVYDEVIHAEDRTMNWHTDFQGERAEEPGEKFAVTMVIYPNDDYDGGEISFTIFDEDEAVFDIPLNRIDYKPGAGDIVFFPSGHPYYHGVLRIYKAPKYIVRGYWKYYYEGSEYWHSLVAKYGEERFKELEKERLERHDFLITDPAQRERYPLHVYYDLLEAGKLPEESMRKTGIELPEL